MIRSNDLALFNHGTCCNNRTCFYICAGEYNGINTDDTVVFYSASVNNGIVANRYIVSDNCRFAEIGMYSKLS